MKQPTSAKLRCETFARLSVVGLSMGGWGSKSRHLIGFQSAPVLKASDTLQTMSHRHSNTSPQSLQIRADAGILGNAVH